MIGDKAIKKGYIEPAPIGLDRLPFIPYMFQISRYGGLIRSDARRWYTNPSARTLDILINRYVQPDKQKYEGNIKAYTLYNDWVIVKFKQNKAQAPFDFSRNFRRELQFILKYDVLKNRRMFLAIMSVAREYQQFFDNNSGGLYDLWFSVFWVKPEMKNKRVLVERRKVKGLNSLYNVLTTGLRTRAASTDKLQSANPQITTLGTVKSNVGVGVSPSFNTKSEDKSTEEQSDLRNGAGNVYNINSKVKLKTDSNTIWAYINNTKIGKICVKNKCIKDLWVEPEYRNKKIASHLMKAAIEKYNPILIRPCSFNKSPITGKITPFSSIDLENFYNKFGFKMTKNGVMIRG